MTPLQRLIGIGQSPWLDTISREALRSGAIAEWVAKGIRGVTTNPAIFEKAIAGSAAYDAEIAELAAEGRTAEQICEELAARDVSEAAGILRPVWEATGGVDGYVSIEVSPRLARDTEGTIEEGRRLWDRLQMPNVMIKVPATLEGLPAIEELIASGINVNVTLLFSVERYRESFLAYEAGCRRLAAQGARVFPESVASFFVSRVDTLIDPQLAAFPELRGAAGVANSLAAYDEFFELISRDEWIALAARGAHVQRLLWASTGVKDPAFSPVKYVADLAGPQTVNTMPEATVEAWMAEGQAADRLGLLMDQAPMTLAQLAAAGIDIDEAADQLEEEGIDKFIQPYESLIAGIEAKRSAAGG